MGTRYRRFALEPIIRSSGMRSVILPRQRICWGTGSSLAGTVVVVISCSLLQAAGSSQSISSHSDQRRPFGGGEVARACPPVANRMPAVGQISLLAGWDLAMFSLLLFSPPPAPDHLITFDGPLGEIAPFRGAIIVGLFVSGRAGGPVPPKTVLILSAPERSFSRTT